MNTPYSLLSVLLAASVAIGLAGCVTSGASSNDGSYRERLGTATPNDIIRETENTLVSRYNYRFDRRITTSEDLRFITQWNVHSPLDDEQQQGISQCRTRITVNARPKSRAGTEVRTYTVIFRSEYEVQKDGRVEWVSAPMTPSRTEYIEEIASYLENQITSGVRTY